MHIQQIPSAKAEMLIRSPIENVFEAFVNPVITSNFWFTSSSGRLEPGKEIRWEWEMYGHSVLVTVEAIEKNRRILIKWDAYETPTTVECLFASRAKDETFVSIINTGFSGNSDKVIEQALSSTEGFTIVLAGAKAFLEYGLVLDLVRDRFPDRVKK